MATATNPKKAPRSSEGLAFTISREALQEVLAAVTPVVPSKTALPVLGNVLIETTDKGVRMSATDLDLWLAAEVAADVEQQGAVTVPAKRLLEIVKELPPSPVRIRQGETAQVRLECGRADFKLYGLLKQEFPSKPKVSYKDGWRIAAGDLTSAIPKITFCVSREESRPVLNGVLWQMPKNALRLVATNGHRLGLLERPVKAAGQPFKEVIIPTKALNQFARLFPAEEEIEIAQSKEFFVVARSSTHEICSRLIEGPYPNYTEVIPKDYKLSARVDRIAFASSVRRVMPLSSEHTRRLNLEFGTANLKLSTLTEDRGEAHDELPVHYAGKAFVVGVNAQYLLDILDAIDTDEVSLRMNSESTAIGIEPVDLVVGRHSFILMPLRPLD